MGSVRVPSKIDRFEVRGVLGSGTQGAVYQAYDPRLERLVAIKTVLADALGDASAGEWLMREARIVGGLKHPNIVPLYEAGTYPEGVYLIFEYVEGRSLAERLRDPNWDGREAGGIMLDVLAGVEAAHAAGILHRDIKPSNVLMGADGRARVTDFGIAMPASAVSEHNREWGSVPYLSPEQITGGQVDARSDVFALGVLFHELLTGKRAFTGGSPEAIRQAIVQRRLEAPSRVSGSGGDPRMDQIVLRATAPAPEDRYADAGAFREALAALGDVGLDAGRGNGLDFMLRRIKRKPDFPGFSRAIQEINRLSAEASNRSVGQLANVVLQDYATTQKLLRLANSSYYGQFGGDIRTISRAIMILGFNQVRMAALSLILFENLKHTDTDKQLVDGLVASLQSALVAKLVASKNGVDSEQAFICALMHDVGRLLVIYYFPEEYGDIRLAAEHRRVPETSAAREVLGVDYAQIGKAVLKEWNFPAAMIDTLTPIADGVVPKAMDEHARLHVACAFSNELCRELAAKDGANPGRIERLAGRYRNALGYTRNQINELVESSRRELRAFVAGTGIHLPHWAQAGVTLPAEAAPAGDGENVDADAPTALQMSDEQRLAILLAGVNEISASLVGSFRLAELLQSILETMYRGVGAEHAVLFIADAGGSHVTARVALGERADEVFGLRLPRAADRRDVIALGLSQDKDIVVQTPPSAHGATRYLPSELDGYLRGERFVVMPVVAAGRRLGLFYLDLPPQVHLGETVLTALKTLRNQAVMALRQGG